MTKPSNTLSSEGTNIHATRLRVSAYHPTSKVNPFTPNKQSKRVKLRVKSSKGRQTQCDHTGKRDRDLSPCSKSVLGVLKRGSRRRPCMTLYDSRSEGQKRLQYIFISVRQMSQVPCQDMDRPAQRLAASQS